MDQFLYNELFCDESTHHPYTMNENGIYYPDKLSAVQLDLMLSKGWYRMGTGIFTTNHIFQNYYVYRVFWLRYNCQQILLAKSQQKLLRQNQVFSHRIAPISLSAEMEDLYTLYKTNIDFNPASSVQEWLLDEKKISIFDTWAIEIRDQEVLVAVGIFDKGQNSIAGIMNFYHPYYRRFSLGKYLMLLKIKHAQEQNQKWYYPGYIVYKNPKFDYKLFADKAAAELFYPELNAWCIYDSDMVRDIAEKKLPKQ